MSTIAISFPVVVRCLLAIVCVSSKTKRIANNILLSMDIEHIRSCNGEAKIFARACAIKRNASISQWQRAFQLVPIKTNFHKLNWIDAVFFPYYTKCVFLYAFGVCAHVFSSRKYLKIGFWRKRDNLHVYWIHCLCWATPYAIPTANLLIGHRAEVCVCV